MGVVGVLVSERWSRWSCVGVTTRLFLRYRLGVLSGIKGSSGLELIWMEVLVGVKVLVGVVVCH